MKSAAPARRRVPHTLDEARPDLRIGLIGTILVHVALLAVFLALPEDWLDAADTNDTPGDAARPFEIELSPEFVRAAEPPAPQRFVEVNPAAPDNVPDMTDLFGKQNQQVAQPVPTPDGESDTPKVDGEAAAGATAIVSGMTAEEPAPSAAEQLAEAFKPPVPPTLIPEAPERPAAEETAAKAVNPLPGGEQLLGESDGGVGTTVATVPPVKGAETGPEAVKGTVDGQPKSTGYFGGTPAIDRTRPMDRPRLAAAAINARQTPTIKNEFGSKNIGAVAYDAKWSAYGEYLQRLIDAVQVQWERLIIRSSFYPTSGSVVRVVFKLDDTGAISEVVKVDGSGAELARRLCVSAITERAPYGEWSEDMIAVLGKEQELTFTFHYQ
ncbi:MAG: hypothetical protein H7067_10010 [Burkholderiales bacterium]|nr:hypothetical protein [Opitutaceae bacterium]